MADITSIRSSYTWRSTHFSYPNSGKGRFADIAELDLVREMFRVFS